MTPFVMDDDVRAKLHALVEYAEQHRYNLEHLLESVNRVNAGEPPLPMPDAHSALLPFGFSVTFTIEQHPNGWVRHMSMAAPRQGRVPNDLAMNWVMGELGFTTSFTECTRWPEHLASGGVALNVVEPLLDNQPTSQAVN